MHMLVQRHIFVEVAPDLFRNNRHSYELRSETGATEMMLVEYVFSRVIYAVASSLANSALKKDQRGLPSGIRMAASNERPEADART